MKLEIGQKVTWSSQAMGGWKEKTGEIVKVIPAGVVCVPSALVNQLRARSALGYGSPRTHESYIVAVSVGKTKKAKPVLYWPVVSKLKPARKEPARNGSYAAGPKP